MDFQGLCMSVGLEAEMNPWEVLFCGGQCVHAAMAGFGQGSDLSGEDSRACNDAAQNKAGWNRGLYSWIANSTEMKVGLSPRKFEAVLTPVSQRATVLFPLGLLVKTKAWSWCLS